MYLSTNNFQKEANVNFPQSNFKEFQCNWQKDNRIATSKLLVYSFPEDDSPLSLTV